MLENFLSILLETLLLTPPTVNRLHVARDKWMRDTSRAFPARLA